MNNEDLYHEVCNIVEFHIPDFHVYDMSMGEVLNVVMNRLKDNGIRVWRKRVEKILIENWF